MTGTDSADSQTAQPPTATGLEDQAPAGKRSLRDAGLASEEDTGLSAGPTTAPAAGSSDSNSDDDDDDDDDFGPSLSVVKQAPKRVKTLAHENLFLDALPSAQLYEKSYMHRDVISFTTVTSSDFVITTSNDGIVKFWKKNKIGIEFVKTFRAHLKPITAVDASRDGSLFVSASSDKFVKIFDVVNFDMISMIELDFTPGACCFAFQPGDAVTTLLVSSLDSRDIHVFDARGGSSVPLRTFKIHRSPTHLMKFDPVHNLVVSADRRGHFEIWDPITGDMPEDGPLTFQSKLDTDLFALVTAGTTPTSISISPHGKLFATLSLDRVVRVFELLSGKMIRSYDESLRVIEEMQQAGTAHIQLDSMEFGLRLAKDRELDKPNSALSSVNTVFDDSGNFLLYPTLLGIKVVNIVTNRVVRILGHGENAARFLHISLHQGALKGKSAATLDMLASDNPALKAARETDPTVFATALKMKRFFMLTTREPGDLDGDAAARDVLNERPAGTAATAAASSVNVASLPTTVVLHTSRGDIVLELFPTVAPRTVENFTTHVRRGYYTNILFHRVIRGFMVQTGDPTGTGFGGQSIWGGTFADEFSADPRARHDRPFVLSMANSGPGTNGSQFFITTAPAPHLDNKHTVFGRVASGSEVVTDIEHVRVDREDRPLDEVRILSSSVRD